MINRIRHIWQILVLYALLMLAGMAIIDLLRFDLKLGTYVLLLTIMTAITSGVYLLISIGNSRGENYRGIFLLAGIGGKFLAYLLLILLFWLPAKNLSKEFIIAFFVLYLVLTFFLVRVLYKILKTNE